MRTPRLACALVFAACSAGHSDAPIDGGSVADARRPDAGGGSSADAAPRKADAAPGSPDAAPADRDAGITGGDTYLPWEGGPAYYAGWSHGLPTDASFFPIAVFWQSAANADNFAAIGINTYVGFFSDDDLTALDQKSMHVVGD